MIRTTPESPLITKNFGGKHDLFMLLEHFSPPARVRCNGKEQLVSSESPPWTPTLRGASSNWLLNPVVGAVTINSKGSPLMTRAQGALSGDRVVRGVALSEPAHISSNTSSPSERCRSRYARLDESVRSIPIRLSRTSERQPSNSSPLSAAHSGSGNRDGRLRALCRSEAFTPTYAALHLRHVSLRRPL